MLKAYNSLSTIQEDLSLGKITVLQLVENYLQTIEDKKDINAFIEVFKDEALTKAVEIQEKLNTKKAGKLAGMVIAIKDNICYKGHVVSASSKMLEGFESIFNATAIEKLLAEDAIIIGRVACDEFAMGGSNENSAFGPVLNPVNKDYVPGGSSGGSAAAVAANMCLAALGSDTGGSIRQPASFCGVVGMKPTYGRVSRHGLIAFASSFDQIGPFAHTVEDCASILEVIAGGDQFDTTSSAQEVDTYTKGIKTEQKRTIAYVAECLESDGLDPEIKNSMLQLIDDLKADGHEVEPVHFPLLDVLVPTYYILTTAEASSNLSRYDGIRFGYRSPNAHDLESTYVLSRSEGFGDEVKRRIMLGNFVLSAGYFDAYYTKAMRIRRQIKEQTEAILANYDFMLMPTTPSTAFKFGENSDDPIKMYLEDIFTVQANLAGVPAISVPLANHSNGLPYGVQLMSGSFQEEKLFAFASQLEKVKV